MKKSTNSPMASPIALAKFSIQIFDPPVHVNIGAGYLDVDMALVSFAVNVDWALQNGVVIERFNLIQHPFAFVDVVAVKKFLEEFDQDALPVVIVNDEVVLAGRYPSRAELMQWAGLAHPAGAPVSDSNLVFTSESLTERGGDAVDSGKAVAVKPKSPKGCSGGGRRR